MSSSPKHTCSIVNDIFVSVTVIKDAEIPKIVLSIQLHFFLSGLSQFCVEFESQITHLLPEVFFSG